jgi:thioredoxin 2
MSHETSRDKIVARCAACGAANRALAERLGDAVCGRCRQKLFAPAPLAVSDATWRRDVLESPLPVVVDFWAPWCGPCRAVAPVLDQVARERAGRVRIAKVNVDENPELSRQFEIQAIPTMMVFRGGRMMEQIRGAVPKAAIDRLLDRLAA